MKNLLLLIALTIICLYCKAQDTTKVKPSAKKLITHNTETGQKKPVNYSIGLLVDSLQYVQLTQEFTKAEILLDNSKGLDHAEVKATISFIEQLKTLFAKQKELQDKARK